MRGVLQHEIRVIVEIVSRKAFLGVGQADPEQNNFELQEGVWSQDHIGLYCKAALSLNRFNN